MPMLCIRTKFTWRGKFGLFGIWNGFTEEFDRIFSSSSVLLEYMAVTLTHMFGVVSGEFGILCASGGCVLVVRWNLFLSLLLLFWG